MSLKIGLIGKGELEVQYIFRKMTQVQAEEIAFSWHYEGDYSFYDIEADQEDLAEFIDPAKRNDAYFVAMNGDDIIGFFCFSQLDDRTVDIGLGMRPDLTGSGNGFDFFRSGMEFAKLTYQATILTLSVATFNERAIRLYKKVGFVEESTFMQQTNGSNYEFIKMSYIYIEEGH